MHYYHPPYGLPNLAQLDAFLKLWSKSSVHMLDGPTMEVNPYDSGVFVPRFDPNRTET